MRFLITLLIAAGVAGCASPSGGGHGASLDTGLIQPGSEVTLTFDQARVVELHCDPHPFMTQHVTVAPGGVTSAHVHILDGNATSEWRFDPPELHVAQGGQVTYHNHGSIAHTASEMTEDMDH